jgi:hypothetical protein
MCVGSCEGFAGAYGDHARLVSACRVKGGTGAVRGRKCQFFEKVEELRLDIEQKFSLCVCESRV